MKKILQVLVFPFAFVSKYFKSFIFLGIVALVFLSTREKDETSFANLAKIYISGPIVSSDSIYRTIKRIQKLPNIKGVLLEVNSPGGLVSASVEISDLIKNLNYKIPVVAYVSGAMASGAYYGGMYASKIVASRGSIIGSIGVIVDSVNVSELLNKVGIKPQGVTAGEYKEIGTMTREWKPKERIFIQNLIDEQYKMFVHDVADARGLDESKYRVFAEGKIFTAPKAQNLGLIDKVGDYDVALDILKELSDVTDPVFLKRPTRIIDSFIEEFSNKLNLALRSALSEASTPTLKARF